MTDFFLIAAIVVGFLAVCVLVDACWYGVSQIAKARSIPVQPSRTRVILNALAQTRRPQ